MPSRKPVFDQIPETDIPRAMLLELARLHGIGPEVAKMLAAKEAAGEFGLRGVTLSRLLVLARGERSREEMAKTSGLSRTTLHVLEFGLSKNLKAESAMKASRGYRVPWLIIFCSALREYGLLPAPGAKPIPRKRTRLRKPD